MNSTNSLKSLFTIISMISFLLISNSNLNVQIVNKKVKNFKITIEKNGNEIILKCNEGCAWTDLAYKNKEEFQAINEFGMTELNKGELGQKENSTEFLFTILRTDNGISLKGLKGTAWTDLGFSLKNNQQQMIDQFGMTN